MNFANKNVLITGGTKGIGKATAIAFADHGATIGLNYNSDSKTATETLKQLSGKGHKLFQSDISKEDNVKILIDSFVNTFGSIDILINNAGVADIHEIDKVDYKQWQESWDRILKTNTIAVANLCYCA